MKNLFKTLVLLLVLIHFECAPTDKAVEPIYFENKAIDDSYFFS